MKNSLNSLDPHKSNKRAANIITATLAISLSSCTHPTPLGKIPTSKPAQAPTTSTPAPRRAPKDLVKKANLSIQQSMAREEQNKKFLDETENSLKATEKKLIQIPDSPIKTDSTSHEEIPHQA